MIMCMKSDGRAGGNVGCGGIVRYVKHGIAFRFLYRHHKAPLYFAAYPPSDVFGSGIEREEFVEVAVVQTAMHMFFYAGEVGYHTVAVQFHGAAVYGHNPVVSVKPAAFAFI